MAEPTEPPRRGPLPTRSDVTGPGVDEPLAVVVAGPGGAGRRRVLADLLDLDPAVLAVPAGSYLVVGHARVPTRAAYVPGYRQPHTYPVDPAGAGPALSRPPRRVELTVTDPLLRHFTVVDTPDTGMLGVAGTRVLLDAAGRAGALLFVISADQVFAAAELDLLAQSARAGVAVFFTVTPGASGWSVSSTADVPTGSAPRRPDGAPGGGAASGPVSVALDAQRAALLAAVPTLAGAPWFPLRTDDVANLRRALVGWAADEGLRRASAQPPVPEGAHRRVPVSARVDPDWPEQLDRQVRSNVHRIRQDLALELANIHLRAVHEIVFGAGCAGLPPLLDREVQALSLLATARCDTAVSALVEDAFARVFGATPEEGVRRRVDAALRWGMTDQHAGPDLDRVLLVTSTAGVAGLSGTGAADALCAYLGGPRDAILPPVAVALSGACWQHWRSPGNGDPGAARSWTQRALREIEMELQREVSRRFEAVRLALAAVLSDAVDHGILLA